MPDVFDARAPSWPGPDLVLRRFAGAAAELRREEPLLELAAAAVAVVVELWRVPSAGSSASAYRFITFATTAR